MIYLGILFVVLGIFAVLGFFYFFIGDKKAEG